MTGWGRGYPQSTNVEIGAKDVSKSSGSIYNGAYGYSKSDGNYNYRIGDPFVDNLYNGVERNAIPRPLVVNANGQCLFFSRRTRHLRRGACVLSFARQTRPCRCYARLWNRNVALLHISTHSPGGRLCAIPQVCSARQRTSSAL